MTPPEALPRIALPPGIAARSVAGVNGLSMRMLEAGAPGQPCILLLHGFPELAYSWRKVMPSLAEAGYHVLAPDQRGYGGTTGWDGAYDGDVGAFRLLNLVRDTLALLDQLGIASVEAIAGHDFGASVAAWCALLRPDVFRRLALLSAPFTGAPKLGSTAAQDPVHDDLARLDPARKHYQQYYSGRDADADMHSASQGLHAFLRAYMHMKSADWPGNHPAPLAGWTAEALAVMPEYYIMRHELGMAATVAPHMPAEPAPWLTDAELAVYAEAFTRTGFQGALNWYRCRTEGRNAELEVFAGRTIDVPSTFIAGASDWGVNQVPGGLAKMRAACPAMTDPVLVQGAGHWVQQERADSVTLALLGLLRRDAVGE